MPLLEKTVKEHPEAFTWQEEKTGLECLFYAMEIKKIGSFRALIHLGADVNERHYTSEDGAYPVHYAVKKDLPDFLTILIQRGADIDNECGWDGDNLDPECSTYSALEIAEDLEREKIIDILNNAEEIRSEYLKAYKEESSHTEKPAEVPVQTVAAPTAEAPVTPNQFQELMREFNALKRKQAETEKQLAETRQELAELKDPGAIVKLPRKSM